jgi:hypothetical protein
MTHLAARRQFLWLAGAAALAPVLRRSALAAATAPGSVVGVQGPCAVERLGGSTPLKVGDAVGVADTIVAPADSRLKLAMSDRSVISLASGTRMTIAAYQIDAAGQRQNARLSLAQGMVRMVAASADRVVEVSTPVGTAATHSADLFLEAQPGWAQCGVLSGSVSFTSAATGHAVTIPGRWGSRLEAGRDPVPARVWGPGEFQLAISRTDVP